MKSKKAKIWLAIQIKEHLNKITKEQELLNKIIKEQEHLNKITIDDKNYDEVINNCSSYSDYKSLIIQFQEDEALKDEVINNCSSYSDYKSLIIQFQEDEALKIKKNIETTLINQINTTLNETINNKNHIIYSHMSILLDKIYEYITDIDTSFLNQHQYNLDAYIQNIITNNQENGFLLFKYETKRIFDTIRRNMGLSICELSKKERRFFVDLLRQDPKTIPDVFIIETLKRIDITSNRCEGRKLADMLFSIGKNPKYFYCESKTEFEKILEIFQLSKYRYLHISCHASNTHIEIGNHEYFTYDEFANLFENQFFQHRVFFSACELGNDIFFEKFLVAQKGKLHSIVAPQTKIDFNHALAIWFAFYTSIFTYHNNMNNTNIQSIIYNLAKIFKDYVPMKIQCFNSQEKQMIENKEIIDNAFNQLVRKSQSTI